MHSLHQKITHSLIAMALLFSVIFSSAAYTPAAGVFAKKSDAEKEFVATYNGIYKYGTSKITKKNIDSFQYIFTADSKSAKYKISNKKDADGKCDYAIQNTLKEGYDYKIKIGGKNGKTLLEVTEIPPAKAVKYTPPVSGTPGEKTLKNFLSTALTPVGTTLYIYGGGWDWQDEGSAIQTRTLGISSDWIRFFKSQKAAYTYKNADPTKSFYPYGSFNEYYYAGLDCSGYLGWTLYNTFETENERPGYVMSSTKLAKTLSENYGWGTWTQKVSAPTSKKSSKIKPGDIMSMNGHVWISLGTCSDGSVVILHSTPSDSRKGTPGGGVQIGAIGSSTSCEAYQLADKYMSTYYPKWYKRYAVSLKSPGTYFSFTGDTAGLFRWDTSSGSIGLKDPDKIKKMAPGEILETLFMED